MFVMIEVVVCTVCDDICVIICVVCDASYMCLVMSALESTITRFNMQGVSIFYQECVWYDDAWYVILVMCVGMCYTI